MVTAIHSRLRAVDSTLKSLLVFLKIVLSIMLITGLTTLNVCAQGKPRLVSEKQMQRVYNEVKTPFKYGLVVIPDSNTKKVDCPTIFRKNKQWNMTYLIYNGRGYETWLAESKDLLHWKTLGKIMSFSDTAHWDNNQKAGYISLIDFKWGGSYKPQRYNGNYWLSYFGGRSRGYEAGLLSIGIAFTNSDITKPNEWHRLNEPVLTAEDGDVRWWENKTIYKNMVIWDKTRTVGHPFVMFYNAKGDSSSKPAAVERIGLAVSDDMIRWTRYLKDPVLDHHIGITGDAMIQKAGDIWIMFYFGAFWKNKPQAFNRFACSYDLVNWTDWKGSDLVTPSKPYDQLYAHKSYVIKWKGIVYHFYCAVNNKEQRGIAVTTSKQLGKSNLTFVR